MWAAFTIEKSTPVAQLGRRLTKTIADYVSRNLQTLHVGSVMTRSADEVSVEPIVHETTFQITQNAGAGRVRTVEREQGHRAYFAEASAVVSMG